jgi:hypothetical protein
LRDHQEECFLRHCFFGRWIVAGFDLGMDFVCCFGNQEQSAADQNDVAARNSETEHGHDRRRQSHHPRQGEQQDDPEDKRHRDADLAGALGLRLRQTRDHDRNENHVVDAEDDLEHAECSQRGPCVWIKQEVDHCSPIGRPDPRQKNTILR